MASVRGRATEESTVVRPPEEPLGGLPLAVPL